MFFFPCNLDRKYTGFQRLLWKISKDKDIYQNGQQWTDLNVSRDSVSCGRNELNKQQTADNAFVPHECYSKQKNKNRSSNHYRKEFRILVQGKKISTLISLLRTSSFYLQSLTKSSFYSTNYFLKRPHPHSVSWFVDEISYLSRTRLNLLLFRNSVIAAWHL